MIDFIPLEDYAHVYYLITLAFMLVLCLLILPNRRAVVASAGVRNSVIVAWGWAYVAVLVALIGLRPISYAFGDMGTYYKSFLDYQYGVPISHEDILFQAIMWLFAKFANAPAFFFFCALVYIVPVAIAARRMLGNYWPIAFFMTIAWFDYYGYAVNGLRQGVASSVFILALTVSWRYSWVLLVAAVGLHIGFLIPAVAYIAVLKFRNPKWYLVGWLCAIVVTSAYAGFGELIAGTGWFGDRWDKYLTVGTYFTKQLKEVGFRMEFLIYSAIPVVVGTYFILVKKFEDRLYDRLFCIYLATNAVWLLAIRSPISNRIAGLSWCMMGLVIAYPLVRCRALRMQHFAYMGILAVLFGYTFIAHL